jgi:hypothetical protein
MKPGVDVSRRDVDPRFFVFTDIASASLWLNAPIPECEGDTSASVREIECQGQGTVDDHFFAQEGRNDVIGLPKGGEDSCLDLLADRMQPEWVAHQRNSATEDDPLGGEERHGVGEGLGDGCRRALKKAKRKRITVVSGERDDCGGRSGRVAMAVVEQGAFLGGEARLESASDNGRRISAN